MPSLSIGFKTDVGRRREVNQDSYAVLRRTELDEKLDALCVVADGMGGVRGGEIASGIVAQTVPAAIHAMLAERNGGKDSLDPARLLRDTLVRANSSVWKRQAEERELRGMGTTCVAAIVQGGQLIVGNVGDSRAYLLRDGVLSQITEDHSEIWEQVKAGNLSREQARRSRYRNVITKAMGLSPNVTPDVDTLRLQEGDTILLCSDGLSSEVSDAEIARILASIPDAQETCDRLVEAALRHGGSDNITVVVLRYGSFTPLAMPDEAAPLPEEEESTDPLQAWRAEAHRDPLEEEDDAFTGAESYGRAYGSDVPPRRSPATRNSPLLIVALIVLTLLAIVESAALYFDYRVLQTTQKRPPVVTVAPTKPTDKPLAYARPILLFAKPVQEGYLLLDPNGNAMVVSLDGTKWRVDANGKGVRIPGLALPAVRPPETDRRNRRDTMPPPAPPRSYMALDASGYLYQTNPVVKSIEKYKADGTRVAANIGKGALKAPASIAVDTLGNLYVIDDHRLKKLAAVDITDRDYPVEPANHTGPNARSNAGH